MNVVIRELAATYNYTLYDIDLDAWSGFSFDRYNEENALQLFRDISHPKPQLTAAAAEKMLGYRYSRFLYPHDIARTEPISSLESFADIKVLLMSDHIDNLNIYYISNINGTLVRYSGIHSIVCGTL